MENRWMPNSGRMANTGGSASSSTTATLPIVAAGRCERMPLRKPKRSGGNLTLSGGETKSPPSQRASLSLERTGTTSVSSSASSALSSWTCPSTFASPSAGSAPVFWMYRAIRAWPSVKSATLRAMPDDALLWNAPPPPPRQPRPAERVWSLRKNVKQVDAELWSDGEYGWECQFLYNGDFAYSRRWTMRADALAEAEAKRRELGGGGG